jgi:2,3-bisphosphoglycerate-independent phosphoglycerate mutase
MKKKAFLMILDGWGIGDKSESDVIHNVPTPNLDKLKEEFAFSTLMTCGEDVGLPHGQMGNSEVGHLNIGAGRVVYQDLVKINKAIEDNSIEDNEVIKTAFQYAKDNDKSVHFLGLVSDGGVHSMDYQLYKLCDIAQKFELKDVFIHALMDGRDTDPKSGLGYMENLQNHLVNSAGKIASVCGRYYTMDRDKRWERVKLGYDLLVNGIGNKEIDAVETMKKSYSNGITDEFIKPTAICGEDGKPVATIKEGDVVFCFNFRTDRLREISIALTQQDMPEHGMKTMPLHYLTMTRYDDSFKNVNIVYDKENVKMTMGEYLSNLGKKQLRIAETEKYAHVTFFFSGGREKEFEGERRVLIPSPKVATYDLQPEMSAYLVKDAVIEEIKKDDLDFICLNFANGDMVGHTGILEAVQKAVRTVDECVGQVVEVAREYGFSLMIIADHGNADNVMNIDHSPNTAHSLNPVPLYLIDDNIKEVKPGILADVAPTLLALMGLEVPEEMTGKVLI